MYDKIHYKLKNIYIKKRNGYDAKQVKKIKSEADEVVITKTIEKNQ